MSEDDTNKPQHAELIPELDYGRAPHTNVLGPVLLTLLGIAIGAGLIVALGVAIFIGGNYPLEGGSTHSIGAPIFFGFLVAFAIVASIRAWRNPDRRWLIIGLLLGVGLMSLVEGFCFASS